MPDKYAIKDFNFKSPRVDMLRKSQGETAHASLPNDPEIYDYPGEYMEPDNGTNYADIRMQELQCQKETVHAGGSSRGISTGCLFTLEDFTREDQNKEYLVTSVSHHINNSSFISGEGVASELYRCSIGVMCKTIPFRTARKTPKPMVQGPQTAIVVGRSGEEIHTEEFGRVKVQFHWDRYGEKDENSSCWVRVSQAWAGAKWGGIHIPRIGQEVIVSFLEGDPDRPIITGRVYNADCMPPYALDANKTQSGIKSRSTKGGGPDNFNEIRMEDKKGSEELYLHAE
jgi:type VI secretion system secreted protein VgrG